MLLLDEGAACDDATPAGGRREGEGSIALGRGTLGWRCMCAARRMRPLKGEIPDRFFIDGWSLESMEMEENRL
jgi:hypothetical protein